MARFDAPPISEWKVNRREGKAGDDGCEEGGDRDELDHAFCEGDDDAHGGLRLSEGGAAPARGAFAGSTLRWRQGPRLHAGADGIELPAGPDQTPDAAQRVRQGLPIRAEVSPEVAGESVSAAHQGSAVDRRGSC
jgi:hypothetical protein